MGCGGSSKSKSAVQTIEPSTVPAAPTQQAATTAPTPQGAPTASAAATAESANKGLKAHGISAEGSDLKAPKDPWLWDHYHKQPGTEKEQMTVENRCYTGFTHAELDFTKPVHAILVDFKGDGMHMGKLVERLVANSQQYVFVGNPLPFNDGWHFTALNDFENEEEQLALDPSWKDIRIWHRVNYVPTTDADGRPALVPKEIYKADDNKAGAIPIDRSFKFSNIYCVGGLMAGTLIANVVKEGTAANALIEEHLKLGTQFATIGHGLGVLVGSGTRQVSAFKGFTAAIMPDQQHLMNISGMKGSNDKVFIDANSDTGSKLVSASSWGKGSSEKWFGELGLSSSKARKDDARTYTMKSKENVFKLDMCQTLGRKSIRAAPNPSDAKRPLVALFLDYRFDPVEAYAAMSQFEDLGIDVQFISHSGNEDMRPVISETVFGNAMYAMHDCYLILPTTPANQVKPDAQFDAFAIAGGQGPFHMMGDPGIIEIVNRTPIGGAVCHGSMVLIGTRWIQPSAPSGPIVTSFNGAWIYFRDYLQRYVTEKPGHVCPIGDHGLITGNSPAAAKEWSDQLCKALLARQTAAC